MSRGPHKILINGALFLESYEQAQEEAKDHSPSFEEWVDQTQSDCTFAEIVKTLLDSMSLLLTTGHGSTYVTACSLDLHLDEYNTHLAPLAKQGTLKRPARDDTAPATGRKRTDAINKGQKHPNFTLRIARNGPCKGKEYRELESLATKILNFLQTGGRFHA